MLHWHPSLLLDKIRRTCSREFGDKKLLSKMYLGFYFYIACTVYFHCLNKWSDCMPSDPWEPSFMPSTDCVQGEITRLQRDMESASNLATSCWLVGSQGSFTVALVGNGRSRRRQREEKSDWLLKTEGENLNCQCLRDCLMMYFRRDYKGNLFLSPGVISRGVVRKRAKTTWLTNVCVNIK